MLAAALAIGGRWFVANQNPMYPQGEGVYAKNTPPAWVKMKQPNAATFYMAASDAFDLNTIFPPKVAGDYNIKYIMDEPASVQKPYVERAQPALALVRQGMRYPYVPEYQSNYFKLNPIQAKGISRPVPNFIMQREIARILAAEANVRAAEGNYAGAMESSLDAIRFGVDNGHGHSLIEGMIGLLIQGIGAQEGVKHVDKLSAPEARAAVKRLEQILTTVPTLPEIITQDRDMVYETLQDVFQYGNIGDTGVFEGENIESFMKGKGGQIVYGATLMYYTKQGLVNDYAAYQDQVLARVKLPFYQASRLPPVSVSPNPLVRIASPNFERAQLSATEKATWNQILLAKLAIQAYRIEHNNAFPRALGDLTTGANPYLSAMPIDAFSVSGKEPLHYNPQTGAVYSVGANGIDENGAGDDNGGLYR